MPPAFLAVLLPALAAAGTSSPGSERCDVRIEKVSPMWGSAGQPITVTGRFGPPAPYKWLVFNGGNSTALEIREWTPTVIKARIPKGVRIKQGSIGIYCNWGRHLYGSGFAPFRTVEEGPERERPDDSDFQLPPLPAGLAAKERADALTGTAQGIWMTQRAMRQGLRIVEEALEAYREAGDEAGEAHAHLMHYYFSNSLGHQERAWRDLLESKRLFEKVLKLADDPGVRWDYGNALVWVGEGYRKRRMFGDARAVAEILRGIHSSEVRYKGSLAIVEQLLGDVDRDQGRFDSAALHYDSAASYYKIMNNRAGIEAYRRAAAEARESAKSYAETRARFELVESTEPAPPPQAAGPAPEPSPSRAFRSADDAAGGLALLRFAVTVHMAEYGKPPPSLESIRLLGLVSMLPRLELKEHPGHSLEIELKGVSARLPKGLTDSGGWGYDPETGSVFIDCTHRGEKGEPWRW